MQPIDIKQFELLENRVVKLEKMLSTCSKQILENNSILTQILSLMNSLSFIDN